MRSLILEYDTAHTPLGRIVEALPAREAVVVLAIDLGGSLAQAQPYPAGTQVVRVDATHMFADDYVARAIKSNARYDGGYFLSAALSRPLIAALAAEHAETLAADTVVHGFSGNDALRIATALLVLAPALRIRTVRDVCGDAMVRPAGEYTVSSNLWGHSTEGGALDDPSTRAPAELWSRSYPNQSELAQLEFERGVPVALNGTRMRLADIVGRLTSLGEPFGAGRFDVVENGQVGLKTRAIYDAPAAAALVTAHEDLERLVCSRREHRFKRLADAEWAELVYDGLWFDPARESLDRLIDGINERVTGRVTLELNPGAVRVVARDSEFAIYDEQRAVHRAGPLFGQHLIDELAAQQSLAACLSRASVAKGNQCFA